MKRRIFTLLLVLAVMFTMSFSTGMVYAAETPEGTPVSTLEELKAIENDPYGKYYLTADIEIPEGFTLFKYEYPPKTAFYGTLDGNGHKLIGITYNHNGGYIQGSALFGKCSGATFKNLTLSDININISSDVGMKFGVLTYWADQGCTFEKITLEGTVNLSGTNDEAGYSFGGLSNYIYEAKAITSCKSKLDINANIVTGTYGSYAAAQIAGLSPFIGKSTVKSCYNTGDITFEGFAPHLTILGVGSASQTKFSSSRNSGDITVKLVDKGEETRTVNVAGVTEAAQTLTSCYNTGKIKVSGVMGGSVNIAGVAGEAISCTKSYNKGSVTVSGKVREAYIGGLLGRGATGNDKKLTKSYNKGKVSVSIKSGTTMVGGVGGEIYDTQNCYNTAAISSSVKGDHIRIGGIAGHGLVRDEKITSCYNTGKITGETQFRGSILGTYSGADIVSKRNIYNNYYTSSAKAYGNSTITWKDWTAKATKVSAITAKNCPKLSTKTWTYSKDKKRMILKDNKEK